MKANSSLADKVTAHLIDLDRVAASMRLPVLRSLKELETTLEQELIQANLTEYKRARVEALLSSVQKSVQKTYSGIMSGQRDMLSTMTTASVMATSKIINQVIGADVTDMSLSASVLTRLVDGTLIEGAPSAEWWSRQAGDLQKRFSDTVRQGLMRGLPTNEIVARVKGTKSNGFKDGIMDISRRSATALVRSSVMAVSNAAREDFYQENADLMTGLMWHSTLDARTTTICKARSGLLWDMQGNPIGHKVAFVRPPAHWNCRSTLIPVLKSWDELTQGPGFERLFRKKLGQRGFSPEQIDSAVARSQSSMDGAVPDTFNYEDWLRTKSKGFQIKVLGQSRYDLWTQGKIGLRDLIDQSGNPLTVDELLAKVKRQ